MTTDLLQVEEHAEVVGSDGQHVGTVDKIDGDHLKLTKNDAAAGGAHHLIPSDWIESVEGKTVRLNKTSLDAKQNWRGQPGDADDKMVEVGAETTGGGSTASGGANNEQAGALGGSSFSGTASGSGRDSDV